MRKDERYVVKPLAEKEQVEIVGGYAPSSSRGRIDSSGSPKIPNIMDDIKCW